VYAGYELFEHVAVTPGSEEYLDSEKYQIRIRDWKAADAEGARWRRTSSGSTRSGGAPGAAAAAQPHGPRSDDDHVLCSASGTSPPTGTATRSSWSSTSTRTRTRETMVHLDMPALGLDWHDSFIAHDEITGEDWSWSQHNYVRLDPGTSPPT
jgi:starch synthase (maltosyl-transferring)